MRVELGERRRVGEQEPLVVTGELGDARAREHAPPFEGDAVLSIPAAIVHRLRARRRDAALLDPWIPAVLVPAKGELDVGGAARQPASPAVEENFVEAVVADGEVVDGRERTRRDALGGEAVGHDLDAVGDAGGAERSDSALEERSVDGRLAAQNGKAAD